MQDAISLFVHQRLEDIMEETVYTQGWLDCFRLLRRMSV